MRVGAASDDSSAGSRSEHCPVLKQENVPRFSTPPRRPPQTDAFWHHPCGAFAGAQLLRYDIRQPSARCQPRSIHRLPDQDAFVALAPSHRNHAMVCPEALQAASCLLAASSLDCVLLLDLRRPSQALLKWPHGDMLCSAQLQQGLPMHGQPVKMQPVKTRMLLDTQGALLLLSGLPTAAPAMMHHVRLCLLSSSELSLLRCGPPRAQDQYAVAQAAVVSRHSC